MDEQAFLVQAFGYWGTGPTLKSAAHNCHRAGAGRTERAVAHLVIGDAHPTIVNDGMNIELKHDSKIYKLGAGFSIGTLMRLEDDNHQKIQST